MRVSKKIKIQNKYFPMFDAYKNIQIMQMRILLVLIAMIFTTEVTIAQNNLPSIKIKSVKKGKEVAFSSITEDAKDTIVIVSFFATWCIPCVTELDNINDVYAEKQAATPFKLIAVSIDDARTAQRVKPFVSGKGWKFDVYQDVNSDLKRAFEVNDVPHVIVIKNNKVVYQHTGYIAGGEDELFEKIKTL